MSKVYITHDQPQFDYNPAKEYGELVTVTSNRYSYKKRSNEVLIQEVIEVLDDFDPENDFILPSGSAISTGLVFARMAANGVNTFKVLMWRSDRGAYEIMEIDITGILEDSDV